MSTINVAKMNIDIPAEYQVLKSFPDDPEGSVPIGLSLNQSENFVLFIPIEGNEYIRQGELNELIQNTRRSIGEAFGLVEANEGITEQGLEYVYRILKVRMNPHGVQYQLAMQIVRDGQGINISGYFDEAGTTGIRDVMVFEMLRREGKITEDMDKWTADPLDPSVTKGFLMNRSEQEQYDAIFPEHPLTVARNFVRYMTNEDDACKIAMVS